MEIKFNDLVFEINKDNKIYIKQYGFIKQNNQYNFVDCHIAGENRTHQMGSKILCGSEYLNLSYVSHKIDNTILEIVQKSDKVRITSYFEKYDNTNSIRINSVIKNISNESIVLEEYSIFSLLGFGKNGIDSTKSLELTSFIQSHHSECQTRTNTFNELGLFRGNNNGQKVISGKNIGSWSTKEKLPLAIVKSNENNAYFAFEIESNNSWYYEFGDIEQEIYLSITTCSLNNTGWYKHLDVNEEYKSDSISICLGKSLNDVLKELTSYRRNITKKHACDKDLPIIFNEYMHLSWDNPNEERTRTLAPFIKDLGVEYYIIDCGWHDEVESEDIYANTGCWKESKKRFPNGLKNTIDYLHSLGLKVGLWIEPELMGIHNEQMYNHYNKNDGILTRNGKPIISRNRYFLDFKSDKVIDYLNKTIDYMVDELKADYIKLDYNEDIGIGTDKYNLSYGEGLKNNSSLYLKWICQIINRHPNCLFETCSSGGLRMDYKTLSNFSICSTSDQVFYDRYAYISSNVFSAVLPEQAGVWSYPVASTLGYDVNFNPSSNWVKENISNRQVIFNMVNAMLGRIHLASNLTLLSDEGIKLVKDGLKVYNELKEFKKNAYPYMPLGFSSFNDDTISSGLKKDSEIYLACYVMNSNKKVSLSLDKNIENVSVVYPFNPNCNIKYHKNKLVVNFAESCSACLVKINLKA